MRLNFASCSGNFLKYSTSLYHNLVYYGPVHQLDVKATNAACITVQGCKDLCGIGVDYYS